MAEGTAGGDASLAPARRLPSRLSPSAISTYESCPRRFEYSRVWRLPDPSGEAAVIGSFVHLVLEGLFGLGADERSLAAARAIARSARSALEASRDFVRLGLDEAGARAFRRRAWEAIAGYFAMEDPRRVEVRAREEDLVAELGGVAMRGILDRLDEEAGGALVVVDYKTGRVPPPRFRATAFGQLEIYGALLEATGVAAARGRLLYLRHREALEVELGKDATRRATERVRQVAAAIARDFAREDFAPRPGPLCRFCAFAAFCPATRRGEAGPALSALLGLMRSEQGAALATTSA